jgi:hypothetical protein
VDPFAFPDLGDIAGEASPFDNITSEPFVRVVRKESAFKALWNALDISFSRVYTIEGNDLVIHSLKALYYILVIGSVLVVGFYWSGAGSDVYEAYDADGNVWEAFSKHFMGLAVVTFGCIAIVVIVRILLEMLLLAWIESARAERDGENRD